MTDVVRAHVLKNSMVLLGLRHPPDAQWFTFGGWAEPGETAEEAMLRELKEELDIAVEEYVRLPDRGARWDGKPAQVAVFAVTTWRGSPRNCAPHEHSAIAWFGRDELESLEMHEAARREALGLLSGQPEG